MKISSSLLKPNVSLLQLEFSKLKHRVSFESPETSEATKLKSFINRQLQELEQLSMIVTVLDQTREGLVPEKVYSHLKKAKHNLRISSRTWSRIISNEARIQKMQERRRDVATVAA
jgi:hypothetical protein